MKYKCTNCGAIFDIDPDSIPSKGAFATCGKCKNRFFLKKDACMETAAIVRGSTKPKRIKWRIPAFAAGLVVLLVLCGVVYFLFQSTESSHRKRMADTFLEAIKTKALTEDNAWDHLDTYVINFSALIRRDENGRPDQGIYFPLNLIDYKFRSEEAIPRGIVKHSPDGATRARSPGKRPGGGAITFDGVNGFFLDSDQEGRLFVIKGLVTNNLPVATKAIPILGSLKNKDGKVLRKKTIYAGITFPEYQVKEKSLTELDSALTNEPHNSIVGPGQTVPFMVIFGTLPGDMSEFALDAISPSYKPKKDPVNTVDKSFESLKKKIIAKNPKQLKIDETNRVITYYDDEIVLYKLHYLLTMTSRQGKVIERNGYVTLNPGWEFYEIVAFKWE